MNKQSNPPPVYGLAGAATGKPTIIKYEPTNQKKGVTK